MMNTNVAKPFSLMMLKFGSYFVRTTQLRRLFRIVPETCKKRYDQVFGLQSIYILPSLGSGAGAGSPLLPIVKDYTTKMESTSRFEI